MKYLHRKPKVVKPELTVVERYEKRRQQCMDRIAYGGTGILTGVMMYVDPTASPEQHLAVPGLIVAGIGFITVAASEAQYLASFRRHDSQQPELLKTSSETTLSVMSKPTDLPHQQAS